MATFSITSDSLFSTVTESIGLIVMVWQLDIDRIHVSEQWQVLTGDPAIADTMTTAQFRATIHPDDLPALNAAILRCLKGNDNYYDAEIRVWSRAARWHWLSARARVVARDANGMGTRMVATFMDANARKDTQLALAESEQRFRAIFETSMHGILVALPSGQILSANPAACRITGFSQDELLQCGCGGLIDPTDSRALAFFAQPSDLHSGSGPCRMRRKDGQLIDVEISAVSFIERSGATHTSIVLHDVTHTTQMEYKLRRLTNLHGARSRCNHAIIHSQSRHELFEAVCQIVVDCNAFGLTWIAVADRDSLQIAAASAKGPEREYLNESVFSLDPSVATGRGPLARAIRERVQVVSNDFLNDPTTMPWRDQAARHGLRAVAVFPLEQIGVTVGALVLHAPELNYFDDQLVELLQEIAQDISFGLDNLHRESALSSSEARFRTLWETSTDSILMIDDNSIITYANPAVETLFGHPAQSLIGQSLATLQAPQQRAQHLKGMRDYLATGTRHVNWRGAGVQGLHADGTLFPLEVAFSEAQIDGQRMFIGFMRDITERKRANDLITNQNRILKMISAGTPLAETLEAIRHMVEQLSGNLRCSIQALREDEGGIAAEIALSLPASFRRAVLEQFRQVRVSVAGPTVQENMPLALLDFVGDAALSDCRAAAAEHGFAAASVWPLFGRQGQLLATVAQYFRRPRGPSAWETALLPAALELATLAIENKRADERILRLAHSDELTGLPNRARFLQDLTHALARAARSGKQVGLLFMDLDRFKNINDTLGHDAGDRVLCEVARRLREVVRDADLVARLGGDEFVVVAENCSGTAALTGIAQKLLDRVAQSIDIDKQQFHLSASIGISVYPDDGKDIHALIKNADVAMYRVKETGRNGYQFYAEQMSAGSLERMVLESGLRHAIEQQQLVLHYQPKLDLLTGQVTGVEALVRWQHPDMGLLGPIKFISLAEETGLIVPMGRWVLQAACRQIQQWQALGMRPPRVAVNLSARQFRHEKLYEDVDTALREHGLTPEALELEVTESLVMDNPEHAVTLLNRFKAAGLHLAMDDFGTGYSSLGNLKRFPFDSVKVDRSFVRDLAFDPNDAAISRAIIAMAHALRLRVVAEGVETVAQLDFLREHGCDEIQGYYFARPMPADALTEFLRTHRDIAVADLAGGR